MLLDFFRMPDNFKAFCFPGTILIFVSTFIHRRIIVAVVVQPRDVNTYIHMYVLKVKYIEIIAQG